AVVLANQSKDGDNTLCAYIVEERNIEGTGERDEEHAKNYRQQLAQSLPAYMIPSYFVTLKKLPLTPNGKVDRKALAQLPLSETQTQTCTAPRDEMEKKLAAIWTEILKHQGKTIGIDDDFFHLGGHSLNTTLLASQIHKAFNVKLSPAEMFKKTTIRTQAERIKEKTKEKFVAIKPAEKKEYYILSAAQKRLYLLQQMETDSTAYNLPYVAPLPIDMNREKLHTVFRQLIRRHESLRTTFHMIEDNPAQRLLETVEFEIENAQTYQQFFRPFQLSKAPLLRVGILKTTGTGEYLMIDMHHIITDGTSQDQLIKEFNHLNKNETLPPLKRQYKDYAEWQQGAKQKQVIKRQEKYWLDLFSGELPQLNLPTDYPRPARQRFEGNNIAFALSNEETRNLKALANENDTTLYMALLTIFTILLSKLSGQEDIVTGTPTAGRRHADLENIIGMFVNTLPLRNTPGGDKKFPEYLKKIKKNSLRAFENQEYPFEDLVDKLAVRRDTGRNPLFDVMFNLLNMPEYQKQDTFKTPIETTTSLNTPNSPNSLNSPNPFITSKFDLTLNGLDTGDSLTFHFEYSIKLFKEETIKRFVIYFKGILQAVSDAPHKRIREIEIITQEEKNR
ncbi:MAG: non-ribosomal peptide synthetase, partial [bacterium]|nr:non-ribosomal peptide synthetase [bacterium]